MLVDDVAELVLALNELTLTGNRFSGAEIFLGLRAGGGGMLKSILSPKDDRIDCGRSEDTEERSFRGDNSEPERTRDAGRSLTGGTFS